MRAGLSMIQQTLTAEAAAVLNQSIGEAGRRNHGQTTPLHVAATLLSSPTGYLRQACIRSHPGSSHPLQCRALELCFSVALDRLPSAGGGGAAASEPPISNALMAALKRAQAHQRRGCPEQQQQPLLAVKVELEQLIVSILDDPSVSRVMREASFSSPAVKAAVEQSIASTSTSSSVSSAAAAAPSFAGGGLGFRPLMAAAAATTTTTLLQPNPNRVSYINPRLQQQYPRQPPSSGGESEVKKLLDVLARRKKRNPVLVGDSELESLVKEVLGRIEKEDCLEASLRNSHIICLEKKITMDRTQIAAQMQELASSIETHLAAAGGGGGGGGGVVLNLGDLKWLVENSNGNHPQRQQQQLVPEAGRTVVAEMGKLLERFNGGGARVWLIGTATCATYLRCQVYHPTMETDWDLQAVPIAPRAAPVSPMFSRNVGTGILTSVVESLNPHKGLAVPATMLAKRPSENTEVSRSSLCKACTENYERELSTLVAGEFEKASSNSRPGAKQTLPSWMQAAKFNGSNTNSLQTREHDMKWKQNSEGSLKRWRETCLRLHPGFHQPTILSERLPLGTLPIHGYYNTKIVPHESLSPLHKHSMNSLLVSNHQTNGNGPTTVAPVKLQVSSLGSPVRTDLALGPTTSIGSLAFEENHKDRVKDLSGCTQDVFFAKQQNDKISGNFDMDSFKKLYKGLMEKISWQPDAASSVATVVNQRRSGEGRRKAFGTKADTWLLFLGPDKVGKKKMAFALSELLFGTGPSIVSFGERRVDYEDGRSSIGFHRRTALNRIADAVKQNPFSVFVIEDVDQADTLVRGSLKQAMESGRLPDSHGREVSLGSGIFIMTADSLPDAFKNSSLESLIRREEKLEAIASCGWQLELLLGEKSGKRRGDDSLSNADRTTRPRIESGLSLDLNLATCVVEEDTKDGSRNSSDLTVEHDPQYGRLNIKQLSSTFPADMIDEVDDAILFKPVEFGPLSKKVSDAVIYKFDSVFAGGHQLQVDGEALECLVAGIWFGEQGLSGFDEWTKNVLLPCFQQLRGKHQALERFVVRLVPLKEETTTRSNSLPSKITISGGQLY